MAKLQMIAVRRKGQRVLINMKDYDGQEKPWEDEPIEINSEDNDGMDQEVPTEENPMDEEVPTEEDTTVDESTETIEEPEEKEEPKAKAKAKPKATRKRADKAEK